MLCQMPFSFYGSRFWFSDNLDFAYKWHLFVQLVLLSLTEFFDKVNCLRMNLSTLVTIKILSQKLSTFRPRTAKRDQKTYYSAEIETACRKLPLGLKIPWPMGNMSRENRKGPMGLESHVVPKLGIRLSQRFLSRECPSDICPSPKRPRDSSPMGHGTQNSGILTCDSKRIGSQSHFSLLFIFLIIK